VVNPEPSDPIRLRSSRPSKSSNTTYRASGDQSAIWPNASVNQTWAEPSAFITESVWNGPMSPVVLQSGAGRYGPELSGASSGPRNEISGGGIRVATTHTSGHSRDLAVAERSTRITARSTIS